MLRSTLFLHGFCMLRECMTLYGECAHEQHVRRTLTLTLTHTITAYSVSGNVVRVRILICATRQKPCRKTVYCVLIKHLKITRKCVLICDLSTVRRLPVGLV